VTDLAAAAGTLRDLHHGSAPLLLANCWDPPSARLTEELGFAAVATSSAAVAAVHSAEDSDSMAPDVVFAALGRIAKAVHVPVTADLEAGYQLAPQDLVRRLLDAGAVGCNPEDTDHHGGQILVDADVQAERLAAVKAAGRSAGVDIVMNARIDVYLHPRGTLEEQQGEALRRGRLYTEAGADCVYPIGLADEGVIRTLVHALGAPVNILLGRGARAVHTLRTLGVARVSLGAGLYRRAMERARQVAGHLHRGKAV